MGEATRGRVYLMGGVTRRRVYLMGGRLEEGFILWGGRLEEGFILWGGATRRSVINRCVTREVILFIDFTRGVLLGRSL